MPKVSMSPVIMEYTMVTNGPVRRTALQRNGEVETRQGDMEGDVHADETD